MTTTRSGLVMRRFARASGLLAAVAAILVIAVAAPRVAEAHAEPERSNPAAGSTIPRAPDVLEIWFTQELFRREGANTIAVTGPDGVVLGGPDGRADDGNVVIDSDDREHLTVGLLPDLPAGTYEVSWTSLSAIDGDAAEGAFTFTIDPTAPEPTPPPTETPEPTAIPTTAPTAEPDATPAAGTNDSDGASFPTWVLIAAVAILGSTVLGAWALLRSPAADEV